MERETRRRPPVLLIAAVALALLLLLAFVVPALIRGALGASGTPGVASSRSASAAPSTPAVRPTTTAPSASASATPTTTPKSSASASPTARASASSPVAKASPKPKPKKTSNPPPVAAPSPRAALTSYYALLPGDKDAAWQRLSSHYQSTTAGPRSYFNSFWGGVRSVSVSNIVQNGSREATATVTFHFTNGTTEVDRTRFDFVEQGGALKIDSSTNL